MQRTEGYLIITLDHFNIFYAVILVPQKHGY